MLNTVKFRHPLDEVITSGSSGPNHIMIAVSRARAADWCCSHCKNPAISLARTPVVLFRKHDSNQVISKAVKRLPTGSLQLFRLFIKLAPKKFRLSGTGCDVSLNPTTAYRS